MLLERYNRDLQLIAQIKLVLSSTGAHFYIHPKTTDSVSHPATDLDLNMYLGPTVTTRECNEEL